MGLRYFEVGVERSTWGLESSQIWVEIQALLLNYVILDKSIHLSEA